MEKLKVKLLISGRVQTVGYRFWARRTAQNLGISCEIKNLDNGQVEAILTGKKEFVEQMIEKCKIGPPLAKVTDLKIKKLT